MAALTGTNGVLLIANTTDTFTPSDGGSKMFQPQAADFYGSAASHLILNDADGVTVLELGVAAGQSVALDAHYFVGLRPWKCPIKAATLTAGGRLRLFF